MNDSRKACGKCGGSVTFHVDRSTNRLFTTMQSILDSIPGEERAQLGEWPVGMGDGSTTYVSGACARCGEITREANCPCGARIHGTDKMVHDGDECEFWKNSLSKMGVFDPAVSIASSARKMRDEGLVAYASMLRGAIVEARKAGVDQDKIDRVTTMVGTIDSVVAKFSEDTAWVYLAENTLCDVFNNLQEWVKETDVGASPSSP